MNKGDKVRVYNMTMGGEVIEEGVATITAILVPGLGAEAWRCRVRFMGETDEYERNILPENVIQESIFKKE